MYSIYVITNILNGKKYVGLTKHDIHHRFKGHVKSAKYDSKFTLHQAIRKHGVENFKIDLFSVHDSFEDAVQSEKNTIKKLNTLVSEGHGYNMTEGGEGFFGLSPDAKKSIARSHLRENLKKSTLEKMRSAKLGKKLPQATKIKMSNSHRGKKFTNEHKEKIKTSLKKAWNLENKKKQSEKNSKSVKQLTTENVIVATFKSLKEASLITGINASNISGCVCNTRKTAGGYRWVLVL